MTTAAGPARIGSTMTAIGIAPADTAKIKRLTVFAADVHELANERPGLERRDLIDELHADLLLLRGDDDDG
jgi:hypothetical protein